MIKLSSKLTMMLGAVLMMAGVAGAALPVSAAQPAGCSCDNPTAAPDPAACGAWCANPGDDTDLMTVVKNIMTAAIYVIGVVAVIVLIIGGFQYTMSQGDAAQVKKAKDTIMYGVIGLVVAILAYAIVAFVLNVL